jgi:solute carrier family 29 (equilibrative nucleoside transporter), member 1/2/3
MFEKQNLQNNLLERENQNIQKSEGDNSKADQAEKKKTESFSMLPNSDMKGSFTALVIFFILGLGNLLPWNAFITASSYYESRFCNTTYEDSFESFFSMFYTVSQPIGLLLTIYFKKKVTTKALVHYPLVIYSAIFILTTIMVLIPSIPKAILFSITLISTFLCGLCGAIMNGGLFGLSGILPAKYTGMLMSGQVNEINKLLIVS